MLSKCLNPHCTAKFRYLWEGRLFRVDFSEAKRKKSALAGKMPLLCAGEKDRRIEHFWLCGDCAMHLSLELSEVCEVRLVSFRPEEQKAQAAAPRCKLAAHAS
jgi:hypothetical protein